MNSTRLRSNHLVNLKTLCIKKASLWSTLGGVVIILSGCATTNTQSTPSLAHDEMGSNQVVVVKTSPGVVDQTDSIRKKSESVAAYHFSLAQAYSADNQSERAVEEYKITLMHDPKSALVHARLATEYVKLGMTTAAIESCKEALVIDPKYSDARIMLAGLLSVGREWATALKEYETVLQQDAQNEEAVAYIAQLQMESGHPEEAAKRLRTFLKGMPDSAIAWYYLGRTEHKMEHLGDAEKAYRKAIVLRPGFPQAGLALGFLFEEQKKNAQALRVYQDLYDQSQDTAAANRLATILLKEEKYKDALPYLEAIDAADPEDLNAKVKIGLIHMELKSYDKSIATFKRILEKNPESDRIHYYMGSIYEELNQADEAITHLKQIAPSSSLFGQASVHVGFLLKKDGRMSAAKSYVQGALIKSQKFPSLHLFLASLEDESKNAEGAVKVLENSLKAFPEDEKIRYYLGTLYERVGKFDKGMEQMEEILKLNPDNVDALNYLGYSWTTRGVRLSDAERLIRRALSLKPDNGYIQDSWGWHLFLRGRVDEAIVELERAARMKPNEPVILEHLADAYLSSNLRDKAFRHYQEALKFADSDEFKDKIRQKLDNLREQLAERDRQTPETPRTPAGSR